MNKAILFAASSLSAAMIFGQAHAQSAPAGGSQIEEVIVTAQRRDQNLQDVPIAVSAFTATAIANSKITGTDDLQTITPGLVWRRVVDSSIPFLRGVGSPGGAGGDESSVALYVDDQYMPTLTANIFAFNNIERIEVLKGPQGTLFGRNATGGLIHIITKTPSHTPSADINVGYGNYETWEGNFYGTTGLGESAAVDLAVHTSQQSKGYGRNTVTGNDANWTDETSIRSKLLWQPTDATDITVSGDYAKVKTDVSNSGQALPGILLAAGGVYTGNYYNAPNSYDPFGHIKQYGGGVKAVQKLGGAQLVSITGYRHSTHEFRFDQDRSPTNLIDNRLHERAKTFTQEFQILSPSESKVQWILGAFYFNNLTQNRPLSVGGNAFAAIGATERYGNQRTKSYSAFGEATVPVMENTDVTVGLRYTEDKKHLTGYYRTLLPTPAISFGPVSVKTSFHKLTYRLVLAHHFSDQTMAYASYNRGFKSGGFDIRSLTNPPFAPEVLDAAAVGFKSDFADGRVRLNAEAFHYDYKNIQLTTTVGVVTNLYNAAAAKVKGFDLEATFAPVDNLTVAASLEYLDAHYTDFPAAQYFVLRPTGGASVANTTAGGVYVPCPNGRTPGILNSGGCDASGNRMIRAPKIAYNLRGDYRIPTEAGEFNLNLTYSFTGSFFWQEENVIKEPSLNMLNAQVGWRNPSDRYGVKVWTRNLLGEHYSVTSAASSQGRIFHAGSPFTYGVTLDAHF